jgi:hypothetical protein
MLNLKRFGLCAVIVLMAAASAMASNFRAGDTVYLPSAGHVASGAVTFVTDAYITNLTTSTVEVSVAFAPTGGGDNSAVPGQTRNITPALAPNERRLISDITNAIFPEKSGSLGYLIFFACRQGGNCTSCDTNPADCSLISVEARIYASGNPAVPGTTGQLFPGIPWYSFVSMNDSAKGLDKVFITGLRQEGSRGVSGYRSNFGILNASQDYSTVIRVSVFTGTGTLVASKDYNLPPLAHIQRGIGDVAPTFATSGTTGYMLVEQISATIVPGGCQACDPGFLAYGSVADKLSDDPTTLESQYLTQLDIGCVYGSKANHRPVRKP